jgi:hypothetical protein
LGTFAFSLCRFFGSGILLFTSGHSVLYSAVSVAGQAGSDTRDEIAMRPRTAAARALWDRAVIRYSDLDCQPRIDNDARFAAA